MQAYIKYKAYNDRKANTSKLKQADYVLILQSKADHQESKIPFTDFRWIGLYIIEKVLPNNNYLVRKIGTNKTQILHRMKLRQFTPRQSLSDIPVTQREWQPDPEVVITHDDLYARAWESEYDEPVFDSDYNNSAPPSPPESTIRSEQTVDEMRSTPGIIPRNSPGNTPQPDGSYDGRNVDHDTQPVADMSNLILRLPTPAAQTMIYATTRNQIIMTILDFDSVKQLSTERIRTLSGNPRNLSWN